MDGDLTFAPTRRRSSVGCRGYNAAVHGDELHRKRGDQSNQHIATPADVLLLMYARAGAPAKPFVGLPGRT